MTKTERQLEAARAFERQAGAARQEPCPVGKCSVCNTEFPLLEGKCMNCRNAEMRSMATIPEPPPAVNAAPPVYEQLIGLIRARAKQGREKYGTHLQPGNGRNALVDALQESIDLNQYLMQRIIEMREAQSGVPTVKEVFEQIQEFDDASFVARWGGDKKSASEALAELNELDKDVLITGYWRLFNSILSITAEGKNALVA